MYLCKFTSILVLENNGCLEGRNPMQIYLFIGQTKQNASVVMSSFCLQSDQCSGCIRSDAAAPGMWAWRLGVCEGAVGGKPGSDWHQRPQWRDTHALRRQAGFSCHHPGETQQEGSHISIWSNSTILCPSLHPFLTQVMCSRLCSGVNELNNNGETPIHVACRLGRTESVKALLGGGAKCDVVGGACYPIHSAMKYSERGWVGVKLSTSTTWCISLFSAVCGCNSWYLMVSAVQINISSPLCTFQSYRYRAAPFGAGRMYLFPQ